MNRTPMLPSNPAFPSVGFSTFALGVLVVSISFSFSLSISVPRIYTQSAPTCQYSSDGYVPRKASIPQEEACRARGEDPAPDHGERGRAAWNDRSIAHVDERRRRAGGRPSFHALPALPRRGGSLRGVQLALERGQPAAGHRGLGCDLRTG